MTYTDTNTKALSLFEISMIRLLSSKISIDPISLRNALDISNLELARVLRVEPRSVQYWVSGEMEPSKTTRIKAGDYIRENVLIAQAIMKFIERLGLVTLILQSDHLAKEVYKSFLLEIRYIMNTLSQFK